MKTNKKEIEGKLIIDDLNENAHRVRRNLLIFSFVAIFYKLSGASINDDVVSCYGITFKHVDENFISIGIYWVVFYHLFHFSLITIAHWQYLRIRVTRNNGGVVTPGMWGGGEYEQLDYLSNPKDSSLYHWHCTHKERIEKLFCDTIANFKQPPENSDTTKKLTLISDIVKSYSGFRKSKRLIKSLTKFDNYLRCYRGVELFRWILLELATPLLAGMIALLYLYFC